MTKLDPVIQIGSRRIGAGEPTYIIAEVGSNHNQSFDTARQLIDAAVKTGVDAVKFQLFRAEALYPVGTEMHKLFKAHEMPPEWVEKLKRHAETQNVHFLASAFDSPSVDLLDSVGVLSHKVASSEMTNIPLLSRIASARRPMILSTGMCDLVDVLEAVEVCSRAGNHSLVLLQCGSMYPLPPELVHLSVMDKFRSLFGCPVGLSDHTLTLTASLSAVARGANVIEKHFTLDKKSKGPDHFYALEPNELKALVEGIREVSVLIGTPQKDLLPKERELGRREGLYASKTIPEGTILDLDQLQVKRPAVGIRARHLSSVVGMKAKGSIAKDSPIRWNDLTHENK